MWYTISLISEYNIYYTTKKSKLKDKKIKFNVFIYNVQEGYEINYDTGQARKK